MPLPAPRLRRPAVASSGFDVAGDELLYPSLEPYRESFAIAAAAGLGLTAHAAEAGPASAAVDAVELLGVRRIGHGSHIVDDPTVLAWAAREGIAIEVCLTSNVFTGAARSIARASPAPVPGGRLPGRHRRRQPGQHRDDALRRGATARDEAGLTAEQVRGIHRTACEVAFTDESTRADAAPEVRRPSAASPSGRRTGATRSPCSGPSPRRARPRRRSWPPPSSRCPAAARSSGRRSRPPRARGARPGRSGGRRRRCRTGPVAAAASSSVGNAGMPRTARLLRVHRHAVVAVVEQRTGRPRTTAGPASRMRR